MKHDIRWVVREGEAHTVSDVLRLSGVPLSFVAEGRVFVGRTRVQSETMAVKVGDEVIVSAPSEGESVELEVIYSSRDFVAIHKPAGIATAPDHESASNTAWGILASQLGVSLNELHPSSRLDRNVSGVVTFSRTESGARCLATLREEGAYERRYVALAKGKVVAPHTLWDAPIGRAKNPRLRQANGKDAMFALTDVCVIARASDTLLLALRPRTGRTHQLRVHAAHAGVPLLGDRSYGGPRRHTLPSGGVITFDRVALHCARVRLRTTEGVPFDIRALVPQDMRGFWLALGGKDEFERACEEPWDRLVGSQS